MNRNCDRDKKSHVVLKYPGYPDVALAGEFRHDLSFSLTGKLWEVLRIANCFSASDRTGLKPPYFKLSSCRGGHLVMIATVRFFDIQADVAALFEDSFFRFQIIGAFNTSSLVSSYNLFFCLEIASPGMFKLTGEMELSLVDSQRIKLLAAETGKPILGNLLLLPGLKMRWNMIAVGDLIISFEIIFQLSIRSSFSYRFSKVPPSERPASINTIVNAITQHASERPYEVLSEIYQSAETWLIAVSDKVITDVENVASVLKTHFQCDSDYIVSAYKNILRESNINTVKALKKAGESAENIAASLIGNGANYSDISSALSAAGFSDINCTQALIRSFG